MAISNFEEVIKHGVERALNQPIVNGLSVVEWAKIGINSPRWISVKDRLPEENVWVLCLCRVGIREVLRWQNGQWYHDPKHAYFESFVLYWMPLPEPPEEEPDANSV